jgi:hypothetical protein
VTVTLNPSLVDDADELANKVGKKRSVAYREFVRRGAVNLLVMAKNRVVDGLDGTKKWIEVNVRRFGKNFTEFREQGSDKPVGGSRILISNEMAAAKHKATEAAFRHKAENLNFGQLFGNSEPTATYSDREGWQDSGRESESSQVHMVQDSEGWVYDKGTESSFAKRKDKGESES